MVSLSERRWRGSLITENKCHCREKNTRSSISRRKTCQTKWLLALSQPNTNEKPMHEGFALPWSSAAGRWHNSVVSLGGKEGHGSQGWKTSLLAHILHGVFLQNMLHHVPLRKEHSLHWKERRKQKWFASLGLSWAAPSFCCTSHVVWHPGAPGMWSQARIINCATPLWLGNLSPLPYLTAAPAASHLLLTAELHDAEQPWSNRTGTAPAWGPDTLVLPPKRQHAFAGPSLEMGDISLLPQAEWRMYLNTLSKPKTRISTNPAGLADISPYSFHLSPCIHFPLILLSLLLPHMCCQTAHIWMQVSLHTSHGPSTFWEKGLAVVLHVKRAASIACCAAPQLAYSIVKWVLMRVEWFLSCLFA